MTAQRNSQPSLEYYSCTARAMRAMTEAQSRWKQGAAIASAAGAAMAATSAAEAAIIYSDPTDIVVEINGTTGEIDFTQFDIDGGGNDLQLSVIRSITSTSSDLFQRGRLDGLGFNKNVFVNPAPFLAKFAPGETIGGASQSVGFLGSAFPPPSLFVDGVTGFAGFKLGSNFGWLRIRWDDTALSDDGIVDKVTVLDWAYENSGASIQAGQVPEPSTLALAALGAAGVLALKRRRRHATHQDAVSVAAN